MALGYLDDSKLYAIASAIRAKTGDSATMSVDDMPDEIGSISTGAVVEPLSVTVNGTYSAPTGYAYSPVTVNVSGGGGDSGFTLLATESLGTVNTSSTTAVNLNKSVVATWENDYEYPLIAIVASIDSPSTQSNGKHIATIAFYIITNNNGATVTSKINYMMSSSGTVSGRTGTTAYGVYPTSSTNTATSITLPMYARCNSSYTGATINDAYTVSVYGVKLYDLLIDG